MVRNYFTIALRFFARQKSFSVINISGLTIGVACTLLIFLYVQDELQFDKFHTDSDKIYRIAFQGNFQGNLTKSTLIGFPVARALEANADISATLRLAHWKTFPVRYETHTFTEDYLLLADKNFFRFFSFALVEGNVDSVLNGERKVVITASAAKKYFGYKGKGDRAPIGKTLVLAQGYTATITGIAADPPANSHFHFTLILSLSSWEHSEPESWINGKVITYVKLKPEVNAADAEKNIITLLQGRLSTELNHLQNTNLEEYKKQGTELSYFLQPLQHIHLRSHLNDEFETNGHLEYILLFSSIAVFIMLLACINFMNLTTAQSAARAKEVGVRKAVGAQNDRLVIQFLGESYLFVVIAVMIAMIILLITLTPFNYFTGKQLAIETIFTNTFLTGILLFILVTGLIAGSYPAFYLTQFNPVEVLKGNLRGKLRSYGIRNLLVIFQFFISTCLIIATLVVYDQLQFMQHADVGFNKNNVINLLHTKNLGQQGPAFKEALLKEPGFIAASYSNRVPPNVDWQSVFRPEGESKDYSFSVYEMDNDHLETMGYELISGRWFVAGRDSASMILNETAAKMLKLNFIQGKKIFTTYDQLAGKYREVIGIVKDFNFQSLKEPIHPLAIIPGFEPNWEMAIRVKDNASEKIPVLEKTFKRFAPDAPFEYSLVAENFENKHSTEKRIAILFIAFTALAIIIACLGLFGLATFTAERQRKSIGIRKVLGASSSNIVQLLNKEFLSLVLIANLLAWPFSWWMMRSWLDQFPYHTSVSLSSFVISAAISFSIAFISITAKAYRASRANPVNSLRTE